MDKEGMYGEIKQVLDYYYVGTHKTDGMIFESNGKQFAIKIVEKKTNYEPEMLMNYTQPSTTQNNTEAIETSIEKKEETIVDKYQKMLNRELTTDKKDYRLTDDEWNTTKIILKDYFARAKEKYKL